VITDFQNGDRRHGLKVTQTLFAFHSNRLSCLISNIKRDIGRKSRFMTERQIESRRCIYNIILFDTTWNLYLNYSRRFARQWRASSGLWSRDVDVEHVTSRDHKPDEARRWRAKRRK